MTYAQAMKELKRMGTAQNRKIYGRHGVTIDMFGVSFANLGVLKKNIKDDHELAVQLWGSGNHDARVLATMIADPEQFKSATLDAWAKELDSYIITDAFSTMAGKTPYARNKAEKWAKSRNEWIGRAGWSVMCRVAANEEELKDDFFESHLATIESDIHKSKNRGRDAMNTAVINIALRNAKLEKKAVAAAKRIGKVDVDHGETSCKTPDAIDYIEKTKKYRKNKARKTVC
jgi:3-methyladenine DNA glycosylase AlkD